jgi:hypothetical protein
MRLPIAARDAIRRWMDDKTNNEAHRDPDYPIDNLVLYLRVAGYHIAKNISERRSDQACPEPRSSIGEAPQ